MTDEAVNTPPAGEAAEPVSPEEAPIADQEAARREGEVSQDSRAAAEAPAPMTGDHGQQQPMALGDVTAQEGTAGGDPEAREEARSGSGTVKLTALHQVIHDGKEYAPETEFEVDEAGAALLESRGVVTRATGDDARAQVEHARIAREASLGRTAPEELPTNPGEQFNDKPVESQTSGQE